MLDTLRAKSTALARKIETSGLPDADSSFSECLVLGSLLNGTTLFDDVAHLEPSMFSLEKHKWIFSAIQELSAAREVVCMASVGQLLFSKDKLASADGVSYLAELATSVPTRTSIEYHVNLIEKQAEAAKWVMSVLGEVERVLNGGSYEHSKDKVFEASQVQVSRRDADDKMVSPEGIVTDINRFFGKQQCGVMTGIAKLDFDTYGLHEGELVIIGARPSDGKTALLTQVCANAAVDEDHRYRTEIISLEMSKEQLLLRTECQLAGVSYHKVRSGEISFEERNELMRIHSRLVEENKQFYIDDSVGWNVHTIRQHVKHSVQIGKKIDVLGIDYLQLMQSAPGQSKESRHLELGEITRGLKLIAREFKTRIILLSQLRRNSETESRRPTKADLRDSGNIEADADVILLLWHDRAKYKGTGFMSSEIIIDKQRNGPTGPVPVWFDRACARFLDR